MTAITFEDHCDGIVERTALLRSRLTDADPTTPVPTCPGWNLGQLLRHLGGAQRWAEETVRVRADGPLPEEHFRDLAPYAEEDLAALGPWLTEGAERLAGTLREAGPDQRLWTPVPGGTTAFYARRFAHETLVHGADAMLALGGDVPVAPPVAVDAVDEWMELGSLPMHFEVHPWTRELLGPGRTLHFHATDTPPELSAEWVVDLTGEALDWRRAHEKCAVAVRGPLTELLLVLYRRRSLADGGVTVSGDTALLDFWLERVAFG
ncbi:maleylpyruvate isomerase family mycothiol-dependent enzyme [Streptomyces sp. NPDC059740]|uniref:maleylpyruvate isomerase family mycothiol-dependent enzyme n=1 Tax=Streptomyces sp. NPDC059740 TaxID=3346926 RepID=UPI003648F444